MKSVIAVLAAAVVAAGAVLGALYRPERERRLEAEGQVEKARAELAEARSLLRAHALFDVVLDLSEDASDLASFERAQAESTRFFDLVRAEIGRTTSQEARAVFTEVLSSRDAVTAALARRDPAVRGTLDAIRRKLHPLLRDPGTPPPAKAVAAPPPASAAPPSAPAASPAAPPAAPLAPREPGR